MKIILLEKTWNRIEKALAQLENLQVGKGLKWTTSDNNARLDLTDEAMAGAVASIHEPHTGTISIAAGSGIPLPSEISSAIVAAIPSGQTPNEGQSVLLTTPSGTRLVYTITRRAISTSGTQVVSFSFDSVTWRAFTSAALL
jgi:hypothetical protein